MSKVTFKEELKKNPKLSRAYNRRRFVWKLMPMWLKKWSVRRNLKELHYERPTHN